MFHSDFKYDKESSFKLYMVYDKSNFNYFKTTPNMHMIRE